MRDTRDSHNVANTTFRPPTASGVVNPASLPTQPIDRPNNDMLRSMGQLASQQLTKAATLQDDEKVNLAAQQGASEVVNQEELESMKTGFDAWTGKHDDREKYVRELATRNSVDRHNAGLVERLDTYQHYKPEDFIAEATADYSVIAKQTYGENTEDYAEAMRQFNLALPKVATRQATWHSSYLKGQSIEQSIEQYTHELDSINSTITGVAGTQDKKEAQFRLDTFFSDDYSVGRQTPEVTRNHKTAALVEQLRVGNTAVYQTAKDSGFLDKMTESQRVAIGKAVTQNVETRGKTIGIDVDAAITDALETGEVSGLATQRMQLEAWHDAGLGTEAERSIYEANRRKLVNAQTKVAGAKGKKEATQANIAVAMGLHDDPVGFASEQFTREEKEGASLGHISNMASELAASHGFDGELSTRTIIDITLNEPAALNDALDKFNTYGTIAPELSEGLQQWVQSLPTILAGNTDNRIQQRLGTLIGIKNQRPAEFAGAFGDDVDELLELAKVYGTFEGSERFEQAWRNLNNNKNSPVTMDSMGLSDTKMTKREYVASTLGIQDMSPAAQQRIVERFDMGFRIHETPQGAANFAKKYIDNVDSEYKGSVVLDGNLYNEQHLNGNDVGDIIGSLELQMDSNGDSPMTYLLANQLPTGSSVQSLDELSDYTILPDVVTGDVVIQSSQFTGSVLLTRDDMLAASEYAQERHEAFTKAVADDKRRNTVMMEHYYKAGNTSNYRYNDIHMDNSKPVTKGWDDFMESMGRREGTIALREEGIIPTEASTIAIPSTFVDNPLFAGIEESPFREDTGLIDVNNTSTDINFDDDNPFIQRLAAQEAERERLRNNPNIPVDNHVRIRYPSGKTADGRKVITPTQMIVQNELAKNIYGVSNQQYSELHKISSEAGNIIRHEGYKGVVYLDSEDYPTWGFGFKLEEPQLATGKWIVGQTRPTQESAVKRLGEELAKHKDNAKNYLRDAGIMAPSEEMVNIFTNMSFNHGVTGMHEYIDLKKALRDGDGQKALFEMKNSKWYESYSGTPENGIDRANELLIRMETELMKQGDWF